MSLQRTPTWEERKLVLNSRIRSRTTGGTSPRLSFGGAQKLNMARKERDEIIAKIGVNEWAEVSSVSSHASIVQRYLGRRSETLVFEPDIDGHPTPIPLTEKLSRKQRKAAKAAAAAAPEGGAAAAGEAAAAAPVATAPA